MNKFVVPNLNKELKRIPIYAESARPASIADKHPGCTPAARAATVRDRGPQCDRTNGLLAPHHTYEPRRVETADDLLSTAHRLAVDILATYNLMNVFGIENVQNADVDQPLLLVANHRSFSTCIPSRASSFAGRDGR